MKRLRKWKGLAALAAVVVFCLYALFNHLNLNPLYLSLIHIWALCP